MPNDREYNGWTNYETWCVALWLDNEEGSHRYWNDRADEALESADNDTDDATSALAKELESEHDEANPRADVFSDLMRAVLQEVNWGEIAFHYVESAKERLPEEETADESEE